MIHHIVFLTLVSLNDVAASPSDNGPPTQCEMSDKAQATVTLYTTAFLTIVSSVTSPFLESFIMAWIAWFPAFRGVTGIGIYLLDAVPLAGIYLSEYGANAVRDYNHADAEVGFMSQVVWWIWHIYVPYSQWDWYARHQTSPNAGAFFARGVAVGVMLVGMSVDYKTRVIRSIGAKAGPLAALAMCIISIAARLSLLGLMSLNLIMAAIKNPNTGTKNAVFVPIYIVFSLIWAAGSLIFLPGRDTEVDLKNDMWPVFNIILRLSSGLFFVCFTCTVAFIIFMSADASNGLDIPAFVACDSVSVWRKIEHILF